VIQPRRANRVRDIWCYGQDERRAPGPALRVALTGLSRAEYFRDEEGKDVLFFVDNIFASRKLGFRKVSGVFRPLFPHRLWAISDIWRPGNGPDAKGNGITSDHKVSITFYQGDALTWPADGLNRTRHPLQVLCALGCKKRRPLKPGPNFEKGITPGPL